MMAPARPLRAWCLYFVGIIFAVPGGLLLALLWAFGALAQSGAHGDGHAQQHDWYKELKQPGTGYSCCDNQPVRAFQDAAGVWQALIDGRWMPVPPRVVLDPWLIKDGMHSHICASKSGYI